MTGFGENLKFSSDYGYLNIIGQFKFHAQLSDPEKSFYIISGPDQVRNFL